MKYKLLSVLDEHFAWVCDEMDVNVSGSVGSGYQLLSNRNQAGAMAWVRVYFSSGADGRMGRPRV